MDFDLSKRIEQDPELVKVSPLGVYPRTFWVEDRLRVLMDAFARYGAADWPVPPEWLEEYVVHVKYLNEQYNKKETRMKVELTAADQFGTDGPAPGAEGVVIGTTYDEDEKWLFVLFKGFKGYFSVREDMVREV